MSSLTANTLDDDRRQIARSSDVVTCRHHLLASHAASAVFGMQHDSLIRIDGKHVADPLPGFVFVGNQEFFGAVVTY